MPQRDSIGNTIAVALALCIVCSFCVSAAAVALKDRQERNQKLDRQRNILEATGIAYNETGEPASELSAEQVEELFQRFEVRLVNLENVEYVEDIDEATYDAVKAARDQQMSVPVGDVEYSPGVDRREKIKRVYFVRDAAGDVQQVVLPVYGKGLWSTMYGYLALRRDLQTIQGLVFYEHGETPGLGGEVDNPAWRAQWQGLKMYNNAGEPIAGVAKGPAPEDNEYLVDGLSGATITCRGVTNLVRYWMGDNAYGPFLDKLSQEFEQGTALASTDVVTEGLHGQE